MPVHDHRAAAQQLRDALIADEQALPASKHLVARGLAAVREAQITLQTAQDALDAAQRHYDHVSQLDSDLEERLTVARARFDPTRRIPEEVLAMIFLEAVEAARGVTEGFAFDLAATCSRWRTIALHSPRIWTRVQCTLDQVDDEASERRWAAYLQTFLDRTCQLPLDVYLDYNGGNCPLHIDLLTTIRALFRRSRTFEFVTSHAFDDEEVVGFLSEEAPRLTHLLVNRGDRLCDDLVDDEIFELTLALCAPRLVAFEFSGFALHFATDRRSPSVEKVKLYLIGGLPSDIPALITNFPRLAELDLTVDTDLSLSTFVLVQHLRHLRLSMLVGSFDMDVVQFLRLPSLQTAHISIFGSDSFAQNVLGAFIASCLATVEVLHLDFSLVPGAAWGITRCTQLKHLEFPLASGRRHSGYSTENEALIDALSTASTGSSWICPQLETLTVTGDVEVPLSYKLLRLAQIRSPRAQAGPPVPLSEITVDDTDGLQERLDDILNVMSLTYE